MHKNIPKLVTDKIEKHQAELKQTSKKHKHLGMPYFKLLKTKHKEKSLKIKSKIQVNGTEEPE